MKIDTIISLDRHGLKAVGDRRKDDNGSPVQSFEAVLLREEKLTHPNDGWTLDVTGERMEQYRDRANRMLGARMQIPVVDEHFATSAKSTMGYMKGIDVRDGSLVARLDMVGEDAIAAANRNFVSVEIEPDVADSSGTEFGEAITRIALTPEPVVRGQDRIAASRTAKGRDVRILPLSTKGSDMDILKKIGEAAGIDGLTEENAVEKLTPVIAGSKKASDLESQLKDRDDTIESLKAKVEAGPKNDKPEVDEDAVEDRAEDLQDRLDSLVTDGQIDPATSEKLAASLLGKKGSRNTIALSTRAAKHAGLTAPYARDIIQALEGNKATPKTGTQTGNQNVMALSRQTPGGESGADPDMKARIAAQTGTTA
ncbi:MAG: hypothetical protein AAF432_00395 [Planctomycetota bacterium]